MDRITIYDTDGYEKSRLGWFDLDAATQVLTEGRRWDGNNWLGVISGMQINRAVLYRTSGGRWVEHCDASHEFNGPDRWQFLTDEQAREWIVASEAEQAEQALDEWFPDTPDESGPGPQGGRPAVGPAISVAYPTDLIARIDAAAAKAGTSRAAWLRQAAETAVDSAGS